MTEPLSVERIADLTASVSRQADTADPHRRWQLVDELNCLAEDLIGQPGVAARRAESEIAQLVAKLRGGLQK